MGVWSRIETLYFVHWWLYFKLKGFIDFEPEFGEIHKPWRKTIYERPTKLGIVVHAISVWCLPKELLQIRPQPQAETNTTHENNSPTTPSFLTTHHSPSTGNKSRGDTFRRLPISNIQHPTSNTRQAREFNASAETSKCRNSSRQKARSRS